MKKKSVGKYLGVLILGAVVLLADGALTLYLFFSKGNPIAAVVLLLLGAAVAFFSLLTRKGSETIRSLSSRARAAVGEERSFEAPRRLVFRCAVMAFAFSWVLPPAFLLLPGGLGVLVAVPLMVICAIRAAKFYSAFDDLGISRRRYFLWHFSAYLISFAVFIALKYLVFEPV